MFWFKILQFHLYKKISDLWREYPIAAKHAFKGYTSVTFFVPVTSSKPIVWDCSIRDIKIDMIFSKFWGFSVGSVKGNLNSEINQHKICDNIFIDKTLRNVSMYKNSGEKFLEKWYTHKNDASVSFWNEGVPYTIIQLDKQLVQGSINFVGYSRAYVLQYTNEGLVEPSSQIHSPWLGGEDTLELLYM